MKVYISGPITGTDDYMERFGQANRILLERGHEVVNPALICSLLPASTTWSEYMDVALVLLHQCDAVFMLRGWKRSSGAFIEHAIGKSLGIKIMYE